MAIVDGLQFFGLGFLEAALPRKHEFNRRQLRSVKKRVLTHAIISRRVPVCPVASMVPLGDQEVRCRGYRQCPTAGDWGDFTNLHDYIEPIASASQEIASMSPDPIPRFSCQSAQGPDQTSEVRGRNRFFIHKNHAAVRSLFFRPDFEQRGNRPPIITG